MNSNAKNRRSRPKHKSQHVVNSKSQITSTGSDIGDHPSHLPSLPVQPRILILG
jgi:hypothetical protein